MEERGISELTTTFSKQCQPAIARESETGCRPDSAPGGFTHKVGAHAYCWLHIILGWKRDVMSGDICPEYRSLERTRWRVMSDGEQDTLL